MRGGIQHAQLAHISAPGLAQLVYINGGPNLVRRKYHRCVAPIVCAIAQQLLSLMANLRPLQSTALYVEFSKARRLFFLDLDACIGDEEIDNHLPHRI